MTEEEIKMQSRYNGNHTLTFKQNVPFDSYGNTGAGFFGSSIIMYMTF